MPRTRQAACAVEAVREGQVTFMRHVTLCDTLNIRTLGTSLYLPTLPRY